MTQHVKQPSVVLRYQMSNYSSPNCYTSDPARANVAEKTLEDGPSPRVPAMQIVD